MDRLTKLVLHNPLALDLLALGGSGTPGSEGEPGAGGEGAGAAAEIEHFRIDMPPACEAGGEKGEVAEKLLHLLALLKLGVVRRKVGAPSFLRAMLAFRRHLASLQLRKAQVLPPPLLSPPSPQLHRRQ